MVEQYPPGNSRRPTVPPATPPAITSRANQEDAATLPEANGDSDHPGRNPAEIQPGPNEPYRPAQTPDEFPGRGGDTDRPDTSPAETPPQPGITPGETPPPD